MTYLLLTVTVMALVAIYAFLMRHWMVAKPLVGTAAVMLILTAIFDQRDNRNGHRRIRPGENFRHYGRRGSHRRLCLYGAGDRSGAIAVQFFQD